MAEFGTATVSGLKPKPRGEVLEELCCNDVFIYLGHGERARRLGALGVKHRAVLVEAL